MTWKRAVFTKCQVLPETLRAPGRISHLFHLHVFLLHLFAFSIHESHELAWRFKLRALVPRFVCSKILQEVLFIAQASSQLRLVDLILILFYG